MVRVWPSASMVSIWVSLGAPKQELFMSRLLPYIQRGVLLGVGAAFNFYIGHNVQPRFHLGALRFIWLDRIYREPRKQLKRVGKILTTLPRLYLDERTRSNKRKDNP
jgi:N-acetylglucosaminyldiphosphoundecaprenol N-acetyl-beta-D-mannosaminyltransferase